MHQIHIARQYVGREKKYNARQLDCGYADAGGFTSFRFLWSTAVSKSKLCQVEARLSETRAATQPRRVVAYTF